MGFSETCAVQEIKATGMQVDKALLNALISALGSAGLAQDALAIFRTMVSTINQTPVNTLYLPPTNHGRSLCQYTSSLAFLMDTSSSAKEGH